MSEKLLLKGLKGSDFQHPKDKEDLDDLERIKLLNVTLESILKMTSESMMKFVKAGSCIEINENQYPSVYKVFIHCCKILEIEKVPKLYLSGQRGISSAVDGITEPIVLISEGAIEVLNEEELYFILGQALGHIKTGHELYHKVADLIVDGLGELIGTMALPIKKELLAWYRVSILSADRAGLLCCQSKDIAISVLAKLAGFIRHYSEPFNTESFILQAKDFKQRESNLLDSFWKNTHYFFNSVKSPLIILRTAELLEWIDSGEYERIIGKGYRSNITEAVDGTKKCSKCGYDKVPSKSFVCPKCGNPA